MKKCCNVKCVMFNMFLLYTLHFTLYTAYAQPVSSQELINNAKKYDGKAVTYEGEVIGDIMKRGEYAWVNVNDAKAAIGIWLESSLTKDILFTGSYKSSGDWVEISGVFNRACLEHGGDLDIHATAIRKIKDGRIIAERLNKQKQNLIFVLLGVLCLVLILKRLK